MLNSLSPVDLISKPGKRLNDYVKVQFNDISQDS